MHAHSRYWHSNHYFYQHVLKSLPPWRSEFIATTTSLESGGADMIEIQSLDPLEMRDRHHALGACLVLHSFVPALILSRGKANNHIARIQGKFIVVHSLQNARGVKKRDRVGTRTQETGIQGAGMSATSRRTR